MAEVPDVVLIATGGLPNTEILEAGNDLVASTWNLASGDVKPAQSVLLYDDTGNHPGMQAAELVAASGAELEVVTPERMFAPEIGGLNHAGYARALSRAGARVTINTRLPLVRREGNKLAATLGSDYGPRREERLVDQVVVEHGTLPLDELCHALRPGSSNGGAVDHGALLSGQAQPSRGDAYQVFRIGDAVASRNIHAAVFDGLRFAKDL